MKSHCPQNGHPCGSSSFKLQISSPYSPLCRCHADSRAQSTQSTRCHRRTELCLPCLLSRCRISESQIIAPKIFPSKFLTWARGSHHLEILLDIVYPSRTLFLLYCTRQEAHIGHILVRAPNAQLSASEVAFAENLVRKASLFAEGLKTGFIAVKDTLQEYGRCSLSLHIVSSHFIPVQSSTSSFTQTRRLPSPNGMASLADRASPPHAPGIPDAFGGNTFVVKC